MLISLTPWLEEEQLFCSLIVGLSLIHHQQVDGP